MADKRHGKQDDTHCKHGSREEQKAQNSATEVREMTVDDLPAVFALGEKLFTSDAWPSLYRTWDDYELLALFSSDRETCLVAEWDGKILGFILGTIIEKRRSPWTYGYIVWLGVAPRHASKGIGKKLVNAITDIFVEEGVRLMIADTDAKNTPALRFFDHMGFDSKRDHVYMSRNLTDHPAYIRKRKAEEAARKRARKKLHLKKRIRTQREGKRNGDS